MTLDETLLQAVIAHRWPLGDTVMELMSRRDVVAVVCVGWAAALGLRFRGRELAVAVLALAAAIGLADLLGARVIKPLVERPRPCHVHPEVALPGACGPGRSMPSNHASTTGAGATVVAVVLRRRGLGLGLVPMALVCLSRVYLGVHFPSDVLVGALLGAAVAAMVLATWRVLPGSPLRASAELPT